MEGRSQSPLQPEHPEPDRSNLQHQARHRQVPSYQFPSPPAQPRRRRRPALSCCECRRRKIKCDQKAPCAHCIRHKTKCTYQLYRDGSESATPARRPEARPRAPASTASPTPSASDRAVPPPALHSGAEVKGQQPLPPASRRPCSPDRSAIEQSSHGHPSTPHEPGVIGRAQSSAAALVGHGAPTPTCSSCGHSSAPGRGREHDVQELLQRMQRLEEFARSMSQVGSGITTAHSTACEAGRKAATIKQVGKPQEWQVMLNKSRDFGRGGWSESAQELADIITCWGEIMGKPSKNPSFHHPETAALVAQAGSFLAKCKKTAHNIKLVRPTRCLPYSLEFLAPPSRDSSDAMAQLYFKSFESTHRILHVPTFWDDYRRYWEQPETATADLRLTVLLVIGIGSSLFDHGTPEAALRNGELVQHWIYAAETWLAGPLEKDRVDVTGLQIYCLTILARQIFSIGGDTVWMSMGSLIHRAMQIGLHRDPQHLPGHPIPVLQAEVRRRLWITILEFAVQASLDSRMPPRISLDEFDSELPSHVDDDEIDESTTVVQPHPKTRFTATSIQLALCDSLPTRLRITQLLNKADHDVSYERILELSSELTDALQKNSNMVKATRGPTTFQRNMLDYLVRRFIIPLHYPFSNQARTNPVYYYSLRQSLDAAIAIMSPEPDPGFSRLMASGGGLFRQGLRVVTMAISLELLVHVQAQRLDGTLQRTNKYRELLKQAVRDMVALSEERIRHGETNVKNHMLLTMVLAQVDAIEADAPVALWLARSARDSLEHCYSILRTRTEKMSMASTPDPSLPGRDIDVGEDFDGGYGLDLDWEAFMLDQTVFDGITA